MIKVSLFRKQYDGDGLSYDPGSLIMEWKSDFDLDKTPSKLEKFKFWKNRPELGEGKYFVIKYYMFCLCIILDLTEKWSKINLILDRHKYFILHRSFTPFSAIFQLHSVLCHCQ